MCQICELANVHKHNAIMKVLEDDPNTNYLEDVATVAECLTTLLLAANNRDLNAGNVSHFLPEFFGHLFNGLNSAPLALN